MNIIESALRRLLRPTQTPWGHSRWETLERCPKEYDLRYNHGIGSRQVSRPAQLGTVAHRGLAASFLAHKHGINGINGFSSRAIDAGHEPEDVKAEAKRLVQAHDHFWSERDPGWDRIVAVEKLVKAELSGVPYTTRLDLVTSKRRLPIVVDHKTASANRGDPQTEFQMSGQLLGILASWSKEPLPRLVINRLVKTASPSFERFEIAFAASQVARFVRDLVMLDRDRRRYERSRFPRRYSACVRRYGLCPYFDLCHAGAGMAEEFYVPRGVNLNEALK